MSQDFDDETGPAPVPGEPEQLAWDLRRAARFTRVFAQLFDTEYLRLAAFNAATKLLGPEWDEVAIEHDIDEDPKGEFAAILEVSENAEDLADLLEQHAAVIDPRTAPPTQ